MPSPKFALKNRKTDPGVTNIRNLGSSHWRRCSGWSIAGLVPFTSFSEYRVEKDKSRTPVWFGRGEDRPLTSAGIWAEWTSVRKVKEGEVTVDLYGCLTTEANETVGAIHSKGMPVIQTEQDEWETSSRGTSATLSRPGWRSSIPGSREHGRRIG